MAGAKSLVIVESPTKAKTIKKMLGSSFKVVSSMGHIIDLPRSKLGIDLDNGYNPEYKIIKGKEKITKELKSDAKTVETIYLATDPDREGEAISWHLREMLLGNISSQVKKAKPGASTRKKKPEPQKTFKRVVFHEITKHAIKEAFEHPLELDDNKVDAQQARRVLDRIVGYFLSPFLWKKVCRGLSAGRVQSIALKFIVDREKEIRAFVPQTFYYVDMVFEKDGQRFTARLNKQNGEKIEFTDRAAAERTAELLRQQAFTVSNKKTTINHKKPNPPFITSSLQQEAFRKLGFSSSRTMLVAQRLYEGVDISDEGAVGLITYMRTDSFNISADAKAAVKQYIGERFGTDYCAAKEYVFKKKGIVQAAHEAIRPTDVQREPEAMGQFLASDEQSLYGLIWKRFVSSFMSEARVERTRLVLTADGYEASANGSRVVFDGYLKVYPDKVSEELLP
jgi:DNA topoisomerase-1